MDGYPSYLVSHNIPFIVLFGLGSTTSDPHDAAGEEYPLLQEKGVYISSELPSVIGAPADDLLECFQDFDAKDAAWNNRPGKGKMGTMGFTYRVVGRAFTLPPHKAKPPPSSPPQSPTADGTSRKSSLVPTLHSPLSPLTPDSPTFPDGIMTSMWFTKHQTLLPCTLISFFNFTLDSNSSTLQDNKLKTEINAIRSSITASAYKLRFVVVLVCEGNGLEANLNDRVVTIRRATNLDSKTLFFMPQHQSSVETRAFVGNILASIQPSCIEYYRDLSKHSRRKRNRGTIPAPTAPPISGTSKTLSSQGWNVRYETKLGCFAEFRQEMDAAGRNYETAYEILLDGDVFESIASWSPRFDEARLLADGLAIRILRCLLWTGQTTSAVQSWSNHRSRVLDLVDRKGKGSSTYGWMAWEARWSTLMAELIERVEVPIFHMPDQPRTPGAVSLDIPDIYAIPEKAFIQGERLPPWDLLHHEGYWLTCSAKCTRLRRKLAYAMPKEDRASPGQSSASHVASQSHMYDTYLCPEPHFEYALPGHSTFDYANLLTETLLKSAKHFSNRQQNRVVERITLDLAREHMKVGHWNDAMLHLKSMWQKLSWRRSGWWKLVEEVSWAVRACARHIGDGETLVAVEWELLSSSLTPRPDWQYNFSRCLDGLDIEGKPQSSINFGSTAPTLSGTFAFGLGRSRVGEPLPSQLTITSLAHKSSSPIIVSEITITFEGGMKDLKIRHDLNEKPIATLVERKVQLYESSLVESPIPSESTPSKLSSQKAPQSLCGLGNLSFSPGVSKVFNFSLLPRDAGEVKATELSLSIREELFDFDIAIALPNQISSKDWWVRTDTGLSARKINTDHSWSIEILSKPPKILIEFPTIRESYYTDEQVMIKIEIINNEEEDVEAQLKVKLHGNFDKVPRLNWTMSGEQSKNSHYATGKITDTSSSHLAERFLGQLTPSARHTETVTFTALPEMAEYTFELKVVYHLISDPDTPISKTITKNLVFIGPFEANYDFKPRVHPRPWPSYFSIPDDEDDPSPSSNVPTSIGLEQLWLLSARIASFAVEPLHIENIKLEVVESRNGAVCKLLQNDDVDSQTTVLGPNAILDRDFPIEVQKRNLEDRRSSIVSFGLCIFWRRESSAEPPTKTTLSVSSLTVPFGEPRVLATAYSSNLSGQYPLTHLSYMLENPSMHLLTFALSMEASEDFAFSGPKTVTVQLVPLSRHAIRYNLLPAQQGVWVWPLLKVVDVGFGKTLKVGAGEGCREDGKGIGIWIAVKS